LTMNDIHREYIQVNDEIVQLCVRRGAVEVIRGCCGTVVMSHRSGWDRVANRVEELRGLSGGPVLPYEDVPPDFVFPYATRESFILNMNPDTILKSSIKIRINEIDRQTLIDGHDRVCEYIKKIPNTRVREYIKKVLGAKDDDE